LTLSLLRSEAVSSSEADKGDRDSDDDGGAGGAPASPSTTQEVDAQEPSTPAGNI